MIIRFSIHFTPENGEELYIKGIDNSYAEDAKSSGKECIEEGIRLEYKGDSLWSTDIDLPQVNKEKQLLSYKYFICKPDGEIYYEAGSMRNISISGKSSFIQTNDLWCGNTQDATLLTAPFANIYFKGKALPYGQTHKSQHELIIRTIATNIPDNCTMLLSGSPASLGSWNLSSALPMTRIEGQRWEINLAAGKFAGEEWEYKFVLYNKESGDYIWEEGCNRCIVIPEIEKHGTHITEAHPAQFGLQKPHIAGVAVPVFSLRSQKSFGVGDFKDLRLLADWAAATGQSIIQLLPINDTTAHLSWMDSYPYNCISTQALHPLYINLDELGAMKNRKLLRELRKEQEYLNSLKFLDYSRSWEAKMKYAKEVFLQDEKTLETNLEYSGFCRANSEWLYPYAVFCALRDHFKSADFTSWKSIELDVNGKKRKFNTSLFSKEMIETLTVEQTPFYESVNFYIWLQYHLNRQMRKTKEYAHKKGVAIKGDIPIGIARCSVEAWQYPHLFNFSQSAGAPPDFFSRTGQNWGFPTYNWEEMGKDNYAWWKQRLTLFAQYFDAYRIDHILGFFRIWEVPIKFTDGRLGHFYPALPFTPQQIREMGVPFDDGYYSNYTPTPNDLFIEDPYKAGLYHPMISAKDGAMYNRLSGGEKEAFNRLYDHFFYSRHNEMWYRNAMRKLQHLIACTNMLACGEDLGMLADSVTECMNNLKILSLELMIMPKQFGIGLGNPATYPYLSVCTTSTHDCETLRMWLGQRNGTIIDSVKDALPGDCIEILKKNLAAPSMLAIFPLQDWISIDSQLRGNNPNDERINDPSNPHHYWRYRMHVTLEELLGASWLNTTIKAIIKESGR